MHSGRNPFTVSMALISSILQISFIGGLCFTLSFTSLFRLVACVFSCLHAVFFLSVHIFVHTLDH